jgi:hypothetical protein
MGGGLMQLVAYGAQDVYLTGDPQITYFKVVYRRHTNFSMECVQQTFNGTPGTNKKVSCTISRNGDLIGAMHVAIPDKTISASSAGLITTGPQSRLFKNHIKEVTIEIGGQQIDKHYGNWLDIWYDLSTDLVSKPKDNLFTSPWFGKEGSTNLTGGQDYSTTAVTGGSPITGDGGVFPTSGTNAGMFGKSYIPLQFWFNRNAGLALPLIALQYHEVKVNITFATEVNNTTPGIGIESKACNDARDFAKAELWVDYFYLDTEERKRFAQMSHEYLIDQLQYTGTESVGSYPTTNKYRLNFNHPVKELVWESDSPLTNVKLMLNGHDRFAARDSSYFTQLQKYYHHTSIPSVRYDGLSTQTTLTGFGTGDTTGADPAAMVGVYSFALRPEEHQPSGTCNFSRIDNATLIGDTGVTSIVGHHLNDQIDIYAVNYNVLRVVSGMGGLAYSN